jgi:hypothetical protein
VVLRAPSRRNSVELFLLIGKQMFGWGTSGQISALEAPFQGTSGAFQSGSEVTVVLGEKVL